MAERLAPPNGPGAGAAPGVLSRLRRGLLEGLRDADDWVFERPHRRQRVLFVFPDPYGWACQAPVAAQLLAQGEVQVRALWDRGDKAGPPDAFCSERDEHLYRQLHIERSAASLAKWHIVVDSHLCSFYPKRRALRAYLHHGAGFGSGGGVAAAESCAVYLGLSEAERRFIEGRQPGLFDSAHAFFPIGFPKADALVDGTFDRNTIRARLGLPDRRTILITSHYTPTSILRALGAQLFSRIAAAFPDCNVIQTGHPWLWQSDVGELEAWRRELVGELQSVVAAHANASLVTDMLAEPLAAVSDLLISDVSSSLTTFGLLDKPIAFFAHPDVERNGKPALAYYLAAAHEFRVLDEAVLACLTALECPQSKAEGRQAIRDDFYAYAGRSAERTANVLRNIGAVCSVKSPRWPRVMDLAANFRAGSLDRG